MVARLAVHQHRQRPRRVAQMALVGLALGLVGAADQPADAQHAGQQHGQHQQEQAGADGDGHGGKGQACTERSQVQR
jgi:hypothetical protein